MDADHLRLDDLGSVARILVGARARLGGYAGCLPLALESLCPAAPAVLPPVVVEPPGLVIALIEVPGRGLGRLSGVELRLEGSAQGEGEGSTAFKPEREVVHVVGERPLRAAPAEEPALGGVEQRGVGEVAMPVHAPIRHLRVEEQRSSK